METGSILDTKEPKNCFLFIGAFMVPTVIAQIVPQFLRFNTAPVFSFIFCLIANAGLGSLVSYFLFGTPASEGSGTDPLMIAAIALLIIGLLPQIIPFSLWCCGDSFEGCSAVLGEIFKAKPDRQEFCDTLAKNRSYAPSIIVHAEAYHVEHYTTTSRDKDGHKKTEHHTREVITYRNDKDLKYKSWQEDGNPIRICEQTSIIHAVVGVEYKLDEEAKDSLEKLRNYMRWEALRHDYHARVSVAFQVNGLTPSVCGTSMPEVPTIMKLFTSCGGRTLYILFTLIGYQNILNAVWCSHGERMRLKLVKRISMKKGLRAKFRKRDDEAIETTFRMVDGSQFINPTYNLNGFQQPMAPIESPYVMPGYTENYVASPIPPEFEIYSQQYGNQPYPPQPPSQGQQPYPPQQQQPYQPYPPPQQQPPFMPYPPPQQQMGGYGMPPPVPVINNSQDNNMLNSPILK